MLRRVRAGRASLLGRAAAARVHLPTLADRLTPWARAGRDVTVFGWRVVSWRHWADALALLFLAGLALYFHRDALLDGRLFYEKDTWAFYVPLALRLDAALSEGALPLWTRSLFGGFPLFADSESGMLYPFNLLLHALLEPVDAIIWRRVTAFAMASAFMYAFGRSMGFRPFAAAIGALVFSYGSFLVAQLHHANLLQSAIWLPLVFCGLEMAFRAVGRRRYQWLAIGSFALSMQTLAVHPQVVLMSLFATGLFIGWRALFGPVRGAKRVMALPGARFAERLQTAAWHAGVFLVNRGGVALAAGVVVLGLGLALGAVQLLPLYELVQYSLRGGGVPYEFATQYSLPLGALAQLAAPQFFQTAPGHWWSAWGSWETALYFGIPGLVLAAVAVLCVHNRHAWFFALLLAVGLLIALGPNAPFNLHRLLWELPGFDAMRAPARFTYLAVFAAAALAGWGAHWLDIHLVAQRPAVSGLRGHLLTWRHAALGLLVALATALPVAAVFGVQLLHRWVEANSANAVGLAQYQRVAGLVTLGNPAIALPIALLQATTLLLALWYVLPRLGHVWKGALLGLLAFDLLTFGGWFHPLASAETLMAEPVAAQYLADHAGEGRVLVRRDAASLDHNRMLPLGVRTLGGYSSIPLQRQLDYLAPLQEGADAFPDVLLDTAGVRYLVANAAFIPLPSYDMVSYDPRRPMTQGNRDNPGGRMTLTGAKATGDQLRVVAALRDAADIPQDTPVAEITLVAADGSRHVVTLRAGRELADWSFDRPDAVLRHTAVQKAFGGREIEPDGYSYPIAVSYAEVPLPRRIEVVAVEYRYLEARGGLRLYGVAVGDPKTNSFGQFRTKPRYKEVYRDQEAIIYENQAALPRAYFVNRAVERTPDYTILSDMVDRSFNPHEMVFLEDPAGDGVAADVQVSERPAGLAASRPAFKAADQVNEAGAMATTVRLEAPEPGYLVLTDSYYPGWRAYLDGRPTPIYRANYLFRAVRVPSGPHDVTFRYEPPLLELGLNISLAALGGLTLLLVTTELWAFTHTSAAALAVARRHSTGQAATFAAIARLGRARDRLRNVDDWPGTGR